MGKVLLATLLLITAGCGTLNENRVEHRGYEVEIQLLPYVLEFEEECGKPINGNVYFADLELINKFSWGAGQVIGMCFPFFLGDVYIDKGWWDLEPDHFRKEELMFHEFGHCVLHRFHDDSVGEFELEKSVMSSSMFYSPFQWELFREKYIKELCK